MLYFMQILREREPHTISITGDNSSGKIKNELTEHNGRSMWGRKPKQAIKIQCGRDREKKGKTTLFQRDEMKKILPLNSVLALKRKKKG